jgi:pyruvate/2-oxoacid:ferredoxin oxidoreductase beta subunit
MEITPPLGPTQPKYTKNDFVSGAEVRWCPGCGDYSILGTMQQTLAKFSIPGKTMCSFQESAVPPGSPTT